jgi:hypothetical protein
MGEERGIWAGDTAAKGNIPIHTRIISTAIRYFMNHTFHTILFLYCKTWVVKRKARKETFLP